MLQSIPYTIIILKTSYDRLEMPCHVPNKSSCDAPQGPLNIQMYIFIYTYITQERIIFST